MQISSIKSSYDTNKNPAFGMKLTSDAHRWLRYIVGTNAIAEHDIEALKVIKPDCTGDIFKGDDGLWHVSLDNAQAGISDKYKTLIECFNFLKNTLIPRILTAEEAAAEAKSKVMTPERIVVDVRA